jgi:hypothetical protein
LVAPMLPFPPRTKAMVNAVVKGVLGVGCVALSSMVCQPCGVQARLDGGGCPRGNLGSFAQRL